ncbi:DUF4873 domain-containing protein [Gandjariella thermophila]|uniref:DUF4873 domain-containing protein n=1 Tax=Gandjariella thermophila TaxID=1931992 RepID=A0A4D4J3K0_9PSEU|nr:DUF4873 domain-containing protein [Gandjariella thermophila]GDY30034.1 DUF4873 domain-containing protein [Gandjariella thermophila]
MAHDEDGYTGDAVLSDGERELAVRVELRGYFEPIDGRYHWYGRVAADGEVAGFAEVGRGRVRLRTPEGVAEGTLSDRDFWGRYRISGTSTPPFPVASAPPEEPAEGPAGF